MITNFNGHDRYDCRPAMLSKQRTALPCIVQGRGDDAAHPPIHPIRLAPDLQGDERVVYEFIARHFLACCSQDAKGTLTTVEIEIRGETFTATGEMILARNYLDVYPYDKWYGNTIPVYQKNQVFAPTSVLMNEGQTTPPKLLDVSCGA